MNTSRSLEVLAPRERLESWKEIAAYLKRSERTVRRWETNEEMPVHRLQHDKRSSVYAYTWELDAWRESRRLEDLDQAEEPPPAPVARPRRLRLAAAVTAIVLTAASGLWLAAGPRDLGGTSNPEALRAYQRARFSDNAGRIQIETGIRHYRDAIRLDPLFARAWSGLATAHVALTWFGETPAAETMAEARREAQQALRLDASLSSGWRVLGFVTHYLDWDHGTAEAHFRKASELNPNDAAALSWFGDFLANMRRFDEARAFYRRAQDAAPRWLEPMVLAGHTYTVTGQPGLAIEAQRRALETEPNYGLGNHFLGRAYLASGDYAAAIRQLRRSNELLGEVPFSLGDLGYALAVGGERSEAERLLADLKARRGRGYYPAFPIAAIELGLGNTEAALEWLERAAEERHTGFYLPSAEPLYDGVRSLPRFRDMLERMHLTGDENQTLAKR